MPLFFAFWVALIFGTSCTVIRPHEFFGIVSNLTGAGAESMQRFMVFWGVAWFAVVKGWHVIEFAMLTWLCAWTLEWWWGKSTTGTVVAAMLFGAAFAATDEWHQSFIPDRFGTIQDVFIDCAGVGLAGLILLRRSERSSAAE